MLEFALNNNHSLQYTSYDICTVYLIVREIIETASSALFLDIYLKFGTNGKRSTRLNDKRHGFHFAIVNFLHLDMPGNRSLK
jgi:hypothetical protein